MDVLNADEFCELLNDTDLLLPKLFGPSSNVICIHKKLIDGNLVKTLLQNVYHSFVRLYNDNKPPMTKKGELANAKSKSNLTVYMLSQSVRQNIEFYKNTVSSIGEVDDNELLLLIQAYAEAILNYWCQKRRIFCAINSDDIEDSHNVSVGEENYARSLLTVGGGCMGQIWKKSKRKSYIGNQILTDKQKAEAKMLYDTVLKFRQSTEEKAQITFSGIKLRDTGGLFIPKEQLQPYLILLNKICRSVLDKKGIVKHGQNVLQVVFNTVNNDDNKQKLREVFLEGTKGIVEDEAAEAFRKEFERKFVHALSNEFLTGMDERIKDSKNDYSKGANGLRDELYVISKKGSKPGKDSNNKVPIKLPKIKKPTKNHLIPKKTLEIDLTPEKSTEEFLTPDKNYVSPIPTQRPLKEVINIATKNNPTVHTTTKQVVINNDNYNNLTTTNPNQVPKTTKDEIPQTPKRAKTIKQTVLAKKLLDEPSKTRVKRVIKLPSRYSL